MNDSTILNLFAELAECESPAESINFVFAHPVLLSSEWQARFAALMPTLPEPKQTSAAHALHSLGLMVESIKRDRSKYPLGPGPVETLLARIRKGEITQTQGLEFARQPDTYHLLGLIYVRILSLRAENAARNNNWKDGLLIQKLILSALEARRSKLEIEQEAMDFCATIHWLDIVARAVWDVPDGFLFRDAVARGESLANTIEDPGGFYAPGEILFRLGVLHLDPYVGGRSSDNYQLQWEMWQRRFTQERAARYEGSVDDAERIPPLRDALSKAADYLRRAAAVRAGVNRGFALKALLQTLVWQGVSGVPPQADEVQAVGSEALILLAGDSYASLRAEIRNLLAFSAGESTKSYAEEADLLEARRILETPISEWRKKNKPPEIIQLFVQTADAVNEKDAQLALDLWLAALPLIDSEDEQIKDSFFRMGIPFVRSALIPKELSSVEGQTVTERAQAAEEIAQNSNWNERERAAMFFGLAFDSTTSDEEAEGLELLARGIEASPELAAMLSPLLLWLKGMLQTGAAVNALNRDAFKEAAMYYMRGAFSFLDARLPRHAFGLVQRAIDLGLNRDAVALNAFIAGASTVSLELENQLGDSIMITLQFYYRQILALLVQRKVKILTLLFLLETAKGNRFANALVQRGRVPWLETPQAQRMLRNIEELERTIDSDPEHPSILDDEMLLTAYVSSQEMKGGATRIEQLRNLQIHFDAELNREIAMQSTSAQDWIPTIDSLQEALGPRSVLLCHFIGRGPHAGGLAIYTLVLTSQDAKLFVGESRSLPSATITFSDEEETITANWFSLVIKALREAVQVEPGPRSASDEALNLLTKDTEQYLTEDLGKLLASLRETGRDHLCIAPHGPLHYYPFHLLGPEDEPLSKTWSVTYLPNLQLLSAAQESPVTKPEHELVAIGLDFDAQNPRGLPPLSGAQAEASAIAKIFGAGALTGSAATKSAVIEALATSRRVHLASHGAHRVSAPAFQCVYLSGEKGEDVLYAYEVLKLDLRGVELVTLSACETALGRFDVSDNLRGFSANLLIAGVSTIIGTLWNVETNAAAFFFEQFYAALHQGAQIGDAFHNAQMQTQTQFPQYRDWGAFYLAGNWK
jgi:CHAT domain-containing protein